MILPYVYYINPFTYIKFITTEKVINMFQASTTDPFGGVLLQSPSTTSIDQREIFSLFLSAGTDKNRKVGFIIC